jgi:hypothetical protein
MEPSAVVPSWVLGATAWTDLAQGVATTLAIAVAGVLAWRRWGKHRPDVCRADLSHSVVTRVLPEGRTLLHVTLLIHNTGEVAITPTEAYTVVFQVLPVESGAFREALLSSSPPLAETITEIAWPELARKTYEPGRLRLVVDSGEVDRREADFILPAGVETVDVYSRVEAEDAKGLGWSATTFVDLPHPAL